MSSKIILVLGATGAQGVAVVNALIAPAADGSPSPYRVRALTRNPSSRRAQDLASKGVELAVGDTENLPSIEAALRGAYGVWVNIDGFTVGEQREIYASMRIFEIAKHVGNVRHYIFSSLPYATKLSNYSPTHRTEHLDAKGRVAEWMQMQPSIVSDDDMSWSIVTTGPYMEMLNDGLLGPLNRRADGTVVFPSPIGDGKVPLISLIDNGYFARYSFDHREEVSRQNLDIVSEMAGWDYLVETFTKVTGIPAVYKRQTIEEWVSNFNGTDRPVSTLGAPGSTSWGKNFGNFLSNYRDSFILKDEEWNARLNPNRMTLEKWMRQTKYNGSITGSTLKLGEDGSYPISGNFEKLATL